MSIMFDRLGSNYYNIAEIFFIAMYLEFVNDCCCLILLFWSMACGYFNCSNVVYERRV